jgi:hypothetical protein
LVVILLVILIVVEPAAVVGMAVVGTEVETVGLLVVESATHITPSPE